MRRIRVIRGMRDINTHGILARQGRLLSVAKDLHRIQRERSSENESWDGSVERLMFNKNAMARKTPQGLFQDHELESKIKATLIKQTQESIAEMEIFANEGFPDVLAELQRLRTKLSQLENP
ncbi:MAG TPA: hypothetical protein VJC06_00910 [Candidatus Paceibacterota bacterium]